MTEPTTQTPHHIFELARLQEDLQSRGIYEISCAFPIVEEFVTKLLQAFKESENGNLNQHSAAAVGGMVSSLLWEQPLTPIVDDINHFTLPEYVSDVLSDSTNYYYPVLNDLVNRFNAIAPTAVYQINNRKKSVLRITDGENTTFYDTHAILHYDVESGAISGGVLGYIKDDQIAYIASCQRIDLPYSPSDIKIPMKDNLVLDDVLMDNVITHFGITYEPVSNHLDDPAVEAAMQSMVNLSNELSADATISSTTDLTSDGESFEPKPEPVE